MTHTSGPSENELHARLNAFLQEDAASETANEDTIRNEVQQLTGGLLTTTPAEQIRSGRQKLDAEIGTVGESYAHALQKFRSELVSTVTAQAAAAREASRLAELREKLADRGLEPPASSWTATAFLGVLGVGELTMISPALMVLNISDRLFVSWLPFSALQVAAIPLVGGMLGAAHFLGKSIRARRHEPGLRQVIIGAASLAGGLCLAIAIGTIQTAFLAAHRVAALSLPFIAIQVGLFAVAAAASAWAAHPYRAEWRQAVRAARRALRNYHTKRRSAGRLAGIVNALVRRQRSLVAQAVFSSEAVLSNGSRQQHLYLGGLLHGLSDSNLDPLESATLDDLDDNWMLQQMRDQFQGARAVGHRGGLAMHGDDSKQRSEQREDDSCEMASSAEKDDICATA